VHRPFAPTMSRWRDHRLYDRPFGIGQITGVTKATAVRRKAVFGCPHRALLKRESSTDKESHPIHQTQELPGSALSRLAKQFSALGVVADQIAHQSTLGDTPAT